MSDSVAFMNSYNEVVFENFVAVLKQNLMFQTQLKLVEAQTGKVAELETQLGAAKRTLGEQSQLQAIIENLTRELNDKREEVRRAGLSEGDRHRIQSALNEKSQEVISLRDQIDVLNREVNQLAPLRSALSVVKEQLAKKIERLEQVESPSKHKARKKVVTVSEEIPAVVSQSTPDSTLLTLTSSPGGFF